MPKEKEPTIEVMNIDEPSKAIKLYKITPAEIAAKLKDYDHLKVIEGDTESYKEVRAALTILVHTRTGIDAHRLQLGVKLRKSLGHINKAGGMLIEPMAPYENRFSLELKAEDDRKTAIKAKKDRIERERVEGIQTKIAAIRGMILGCALMGVQELQEISKKLEDMTIGDDFIEFTDEAEKVLDTTYTAVQDAIATRIKLDKEAEERKAEAERLKEVGRKQAAAQAKIAEAQKKIDDDKAKLEADKKADEDRKKQEALEKAATEKAEAAAAQKVLDDAAEKEEKDRAEEVERERKAALKPDKEKLSVWIQNCLNPGPTLKDKKAKRILIETTEQINLILQDAMNKVVKL